MFCSFIIFDPDENYTKKIYLLENILIYLTKGRNWSSDDDLQPNAIEYEHYSTNDFNTVFARYIQFAV